MLFFPTAAALAHGQGVVDCKADQSPIIGVRLIRYEVSLFDREYFLKVDAGMIDSYGTFRNSQSTGCS